MAKEKKSRKNRAMKVWGAVTALVLVVTVTANILCTSVFNGFLDIFFGGVRPEYDREIVSIRSCFSASFITSYRRWKLVRMQKAKKKHLQSFGNGFQIAANAKCNGIGWIQSAEMRRGESGRNGWWCSRNGDGSGTRHPFTPGQEGRSGQLPGSALWL